MHAPESKKSPTGEQRSRSSEATRLLAAALVPLGLLASASAEAGGPSLPSLLSHVEGTVSGSEPNYLYEFTVFNDSLTGRADSAGNPTPGSFEIVDWELPFFAEDDLNFGTITSPNGWGHEILKRQDDGTYRLLNGDHSNYFEGGPYGNYTWNYDAAVDPLLGIDPDLYGPNPAVFNEAPYIIHWVTLCVEAEAFGTNAGLDEPLTCNAQFGIPGNPIPEGEENFLSGFSFVSAFSDQNAPYLASWFRQPPTSGDPPIPQQGFGTPFSPARQLAQGISASVPAPGTALLLGAGLVAFGLGRRALIA